VGLVGADSFPAVSQPDVTATLADLERKLAALEQTLASAAAPPPPPPPPPVAAAPAAAAPGPQAPPVPEPAREARQALEALEQIRDRFVRAADELITAYRAVLDRLEQAAAAPEEPAVDGHVTVEVSPVGDMATLAGFEHALARVPGAHGARMRSFQDGRALFDVDLTVRVVLGTELRATAPVPFRVASATPTHVAIALGGPGA
jgi:hypothetical protein